MVCPRLPFSLLCFHMKVQALAKETEDKKEEEKIREGKSENVDSKDSTWSSPPVTDIQNKSGEKGMKP